MYSQGNNKIQQEVEVTVRNLPNDAKNDDIIEYLQIAGPIKSSRFVREEERYSAIIVYHDSESAEQCKKYLADKYFKGRALTITSQVKKNFINNALAIAPSACSPEDDLAKQISNLKRQQRKVLLGLLKNIKSDGKIFEMFLESRPKLIQSLLSKGMFE